MSKLLQDVNLGKNLKMIRKAKKMRQIDVCARMDLLGRPMLQSTYAQIESGKRNLFISDLIAFTKVFGVSYDELFAGLEMISKFQKIEL